MSCFLSFFFQAEDGIRDHCVTGVQTCALPISERHARRGTSDAMAEHRRILAVTSHAPSRERLCALLGVAGFQADVRSLAREAEAEIAGQRPPAALVLDLALADLDSVDFVRRVA